MVVRGRGLRGAPLAVASAVAAALLAACLDSPADNADAGPPVQLLVNPDFEDGSSGWSADGAIEIETASELGLPESGAGPSVAVLGREDMQVDVLAQAVVVPLAARELELAGIRCYSTDETGGQVFDTFTISIDPGDGQPVEVLVNDSNRDAAVGDQCDWLTFQKSAVDHAGEEIQLVIEAVMDDEVRTSFAIDGLTLTASF